MKGLLLSRFPFQAIQFRDWGVAILWLGAVVGWDSHPATCSLLWASCLKEKQVWVPPPPAMVSTQSSGQGINSVSCNEVCSFWGCESKRVPEKHLFLLYWLRQSLRLCGKFWRRREYQTTWPASWETYMQVRKQQLELDMEQQTGSK